MPGRAAEVAIVTAAAALITAAMALGVLRAPSERVFGMETVARHHDPFTVMQQFARPIGLGVYSQPVTDLTGAMLARVSGPVAAYNWMILLSFPLAAATGYLLARHLELSVVAATVAAMAYAFSPFHVAHAAYHLHIAQVHWVALYLLALWRCLDDASPAAVAFLGAATLAVALSNFYGGLIAIVITPAAVVAYSTVSLRAGRSTRRSVVLTVAALAAIAVLGIAYLLYAASAVVSDRVSFAFVRADLFRYSAKWWSYLLPPVAHPALGEAVNRFWIGAGVREGLLEQQVSVGAGIVVLGLVAVASWAISPRERSALAYVPVLVVVAAAALLCSLSPERVIGPFTFVRPSAFLYTIVPMFRSYARFGVVVQLMAALLAGIGVDRLRRAGTKRAQAAWIALVVLVAGEYAVAPSAMWRDVLPTTAHRWVAQQSGPVRVLDCTPRDDESASVEWLTAGRVSLLGTTIGDCTDPNLPGTLAAEGYTHLLVRTGSAAERLFAGDITPGGLLAASHFNDARLFAVVAPVPAIYTATLTGFSAGEHDAEWSWRWMGPDAAWMIVNTGARPIVATLSLELSAFRRPRRLELLLDGRRLETLAVAEARGRYQVGPMLVVAGGHDLVFRPVDLPTVASDVIDNGDRRPLSFALGAWAWRVAEEQP